MPALLKRPRRTQSPQIDPRVPGFFRATLNVQAFRVVRLWLVVADHSNFGLTFCLRRAQLPVGLSVCVRGLADRSRRGLSGSTTPHELFAEGAGDLLTRGLSRPDGTFLNGAGFGNPARPRFDG